MQLKAVSFAINVIAFLVMHLIAIIFVILKQNEIRFGYFI